MEECDRFVVARASDLGDGERLLVELNGRSIGIFNLSGRYYGLLNRCPHRGAELCKGQVSGMVCSEAPGEFEYDRTRPLVLCPWHGWEFDITSGQSFFDPRGLRARPYQVDVEAGSAVMSEMDRGEVAWTPEQHAELVGKGRAPGFGAVPGPYKVETIDVAVEDDYLVVNLRRVAASTPGAQQPEAP